MKEITMGLIARSWLTAIVLLLGIGMVTGALFGSSGLSDAQSGAIYLVTQALAVTGTTWAARSAAGMPGRFGLAVLPVPALWHLASVVLWVNGDMSAGAMLLWTVLWLVIAVVTATGMAVVWRHRSTAQVNQYQ